jgi:methyl-accepting chemotaxis protein
MLSRDLPAADADDLVRFVDTLTSSGAIDLRSRPTLVGCETERERLVARGLGIFLDRLVADLRTLGGHINDASTRGRTADLLGTVADDAAVQARRTDEILAAVRQSAVGAVHVSELSATTSETVAALRMAASSSTEAMRASLEKLDDAGHRTVELEVRTATLMTAVERIAAFTKTVSRIADQTNLLSLNAAIEAARAGVSGRTFAVVAQEIRKLADAAAAAAAEIGETVTLVAASARETRAGVVETTATIQEAAVDAVRVRGEIKAIESFVARTDDDAASIAAVAEQQSTALGLVVETVAAAQQEADLGAQRASALRDAKVGDLNRDASAILGRYRIGSIADRMYELACETAVEIESVLARHVGPLRRRGIDLFATDYREMRGVAVERLAKLCDVSRAPRDGFDPPKYYTSWDLDLDDDLKVVVDESGFREPAIALFCIVDLNGFLTMHRRDARQDVTGERDRDRTGNRVKRIFDTDVALRSARVGLHADDVPRRSPRHAFRSVGLEIDRVPSGERAMLVQSYARDTGEVVNDLAVPLYVDGRRWGALRVGYRADAL